MSNTATAIMMLPIATSVLAGRGARAAGGAGGGGTDSRGERELATALLLAVAYGANIGGVATLIGTPPNALLAGFADEAYGIRIGFVEWMAVGVPLVALSLPVVWLLLTRVLYRLPRGAEPRSGEAAPSDAAASGTAPSGTAASPGGPAGRFAGPERVAGAVATLAAAAWVARPLLERYVPGLSDAGIAIGAALLLFLLPARPSGAPVLTWSDVEKLPWGVLILFGGGLSLAAAVEGNGLADWIGASMHGVGAWPPVLVIAVVTTVVIFLTELTSNTATAAAFLPVVAGLAIGIGLGPLDLAVPAAIAASCAFMLPVATPPNAVVFGSGRITVPEMARAGILLNILFVALITVAQVTLAARIFGG